MNTTAKAHEPTMEEILASIRRIISDDEPAPAAKPAPAAVKPAEDPAAAGLGQDDIDAMLASFDTVEPAPKAAPKPAPKAELAPEPRPEPKAKAVEPPPMAESPDDLDVLELTDDMAAADMMAGMDEDMAAHMAAKPVFAPPPPSRAPEPPAYRPAPAPTESLLSAQTGDAVSNAFGSLAHTILSTNGRTIDEVVKEMLRPMLRSWLDDNLPPLVERLVRAEIERVARGR